jgi:CheY-like chemotaxis protein
MQEPIACRLDRGLADRIRFARRVAGMSQEDLAAAIGARRAEVERTEAGLVVLSAATMLRCAVALDVPLGWLYGIDDSDLWPDTVIAALLGDPAVAELACTFGRIREPEKRRALVAMATRLAAPRKRPEPPLPVILAAPDAAARVLLVDDAPDVLVVIGAFLRSGGYEVVRAHDAEAALDVLRTADRLDVLVTDYAMPGMNGLDLLARAHALRPALPALVITAYAADLVFGAEDVTVLAKPFSRVELLGAVAALCRHDAPPLARGGARP